MQGAWHTVGQRWREDRVQEQRGAGLGPAVQHRPAQRCGVLPTSHAPRNMPPSLSFFSPDSGSGFGCASLRVSVRRRASTLVVPPLKRPEDSQGMPSSPQTSYFGPIPNTSSWLMAGEPEACGLTIKGENQAGTENRPGLTASLPSHARLLGDPARGRWPGLCHKRGTLPRPSQ